MSALGFLSTVKRAEEAGKMPEALNVDPPNPNASALEKPGLLSKTLSQPGSSPDPEGSHSPLPAHTIAFTRPAKTVKEQSEMRAQKGGGPRKKLS